MLPWNKAFFIELCEQHHLQVTILDDWVFGFHQSISSFSEYFWLTHANPRFLGLCWSGWHVIIMKMQSILWDQLYTYYRSNKGLHNLMQYFLSVPYKLSLSTPPPQPPSTLSLWVGNRPMISYLNLRHWKNHQNPFYTFIFSWFQIKITFFIYTNWNWLSHILCTYNILGNKMHINN